MLSHGLCMAYMFCADGGFVDEKDRMVSGAGPDHRHTVRVQGPEEAVGVPEESQVQRGQQLASTDIEGSSQQGRDGRRGCRGTLPHQRGRPRHLHHGVVLHMNKVHLIDCMEYMKTVALMDDIE